MNKKYKITLPDGEERFLIQEDKPYIGAEYKTIITVEDEDFEFNGEYDEGDVEVEEIPMDYDEVQYQIRQDLKQFTTKEFNAKHTIIFKSDTLKALLEQNIDFSYEETTKYNIHGIHFNFQENNVDVVAINGPALSFVTIPNIYGFIGKFTIPLPVLYEILDYVDTNQDITLSLSQDLKQINFGEQKDFKLIDAEYPNYKQHICYETSMCAKIPTKEFSVLLEKYQNQESVLLKFSNNALHINEGKIDCEFQGNVDIKLNTKYLANVIKQINGNEFLLKTNGSKAKVLIQEMNNTDKMYIVMPMN